MKMKMAPVTAINMDGGTNWPPVDNIIHMFEDKSDDVDAIGLLKILQSTTDGIDDASIPKRREIYGSNSLPPPIMKSYLHFLLDAMKERMVVFLLFAAFITVGVGIYETVSGTPNAWLEGVAIVAAIAIITGVNSVNDHRKQARFRKLNDTSLSLRTVKIIREGKTLQLPTDELVVGDIMEITMGDVLACDAILLTGNSIKTDESGITGETRQISKLPILRKKTQQTKNNINKNVNNIKIQTEEEGEQEDDFYLISGTTVVDGNGKALVLLVGEHSTQGKTMSDLRVDPPPTPLQIKLAHLAKRLATIGLVVAAITLTALLIIFFLKRASSPTGTIIDGLISVLLVGISIIVMAIPEGLPLAVTLSLAYATIHMLKDNNLVRHLTACETMGGATTVCSDKTGTLTVNKMTIVKACVFSMDYDHRADNEDAVFEEIKNAPQWKEFATGIMLNTEAYEASVAGKLRFLGSQTEVALLEWLRKIDSTLDYSIARKDAQILGKNPFNSERKRSSILTTMEDGRNMVFVKGASEMVLSICDRYVDQTGNVVPLDSTERERLESLISEMANATLRTICCAYKETTTDNQEEVDDDNEFILYGLFGLEDPLRDTAGHSVQQCQRAGIIVRMVTGDNAVTARSIAKQCGIIQSPNDIVIEGPDFRKIIQGNDQKAIAALLPNLRVMARSSPNDKLLLVNALKDLRETVAVTGDGANDAPALKSSHVGFSMGIAGTEVAKEASDIVLLDDNFASIVRAILWGRAIYSGIQKFITFQLSVNISAVIITVVTAIESTIATGIPIPGLTTLQILLLNLVQIVLLPWRCQLINQLFSYWIESLTVKPTTSLPATCGE